MSDDPAAGTDADPGPGPAQAAALVEALSAAERDRVEERVAELLDPLGSAHAMAILREFAFAAGPLRFSDLEATLGVSPTTLSERLRELTAAGLLERTAYDEVPPRVEYEPTPRAETLFPVFGHLHRWAMAVELEDAPVDGDRLRGLEADPSGDGDQHVDL